MSRLKLNVSGKIFETTKETLVKFPDSKLAQMVSDNKVDVVHLDIDPVYFRAVLDWLR